jgi:hypothetical protein
MSRLSVSAAARASLKEKPFDKFDWMSRKRRRRKVNNRLPNRDLTALLASPNFLDAIVEPRLD